MTFYWSTHFPSKAYPYPIKSICKYITSSYTKSTKGLLQTVNVSDNGVIKDWKKKKKESKSSSNKAYQKGTKAVPVHLQREAGDAEAHAVTYDEGKWWQRKRKEPNLQKGRLLNWSWTVWEMFSIKQNFEKDELKNRKNKIGLESGKENCCPKYCLWCLFSQCSQSWDLAGIGSRGSLQSSVYTFFSQENNGGTKWSFFPYVFLFYNFKE